MFITICINYCIYSSPGGNLQQYLISAYLKYMQWIKYVEILKGGTSLNSLEHYCTHLYRQGTKLSWLLIERVVVLARNVWRFTKFVTF
jgi:hypothetical protein